MALTPMVTRHECELAEHSAAWEVLVGSLVSQLLDSNWDTRHEYRRALQLNWERCGLPSGPVHWSPMEDDLQAALVAAIEVVDADEERIRAWWRAALAEGRKRRMI